MNSSAIGDEFPNPFTMIPGVGDDSEVVIKFAQNHVVFSPKDTGWAPPVISWFKNHYNHH